MSAASVIVVEDDARTLDLLCAVLASQDDLEVQARCTSLADARAALKAHSPDVLLTDLGLPDGNAVELIREVTAHFPQTLSMVVSMFGDETNVLGAIMAGAKGYLLKDGNEIAIADSVRQVLAGGSPVSPAIARYLLVQLQGDQNTGAQQAARPASRLLSAREAEVLDWVAKGYRSKEIAGKLDISYHTVVHHIRSIYDKLAVSSRSQAIYRASQLGELR